MIAFTVGATLPLLTITLFGQSVRAWATVVAVVAALALTGYASARIAQAAIRRAMIRNMAGGLLAMLVTYGIGAMVGAGTG